VLQALLLSQGLFVRQKERLHLFPGGIIEADRIWGLLHVGKIKKRFQNMIAVNSLFHIFLETLHGIERFPIHVPEQVFDGLQPHGLKPFPLVK
jgi:hypothetical protein